MPIKALENFEDAKNTLSEYLAKKRHYSKYRKWCYSYSYY